MGDWSNGYDGGLQNRRLGFDSLVPRLIDAVIFDLDGVLLDSEAAWRDAKRDIVGEWGGVWKDEASRAMLGMSAPEWSVYMRDELQVDRDPAEIDAEVVRRLLEGYRERLPLLPGAREAVERLAARWPLGLASSSNLEVIEVVMESGGFAPSFKTWVSSEEVARGKPAPDVFLEAARRLGRRPRDDRRDRGLPQRHPLRPRRGHGRDRAAERGVPARRRRARAGGPRARQPRRADRRDD